MKILITPEANTAETAGSTVRTNAVAMAALKSGHEVAFCAGNDINFVKIEGVKNYHSDVPSPIGLPKILGRPAYKLYKHFGIQKREFVDDYETIFRYIGLSSKSFFKKDVINVRKAIQSFKPDVIFTEHRLSPIVAAKLEKIKVVSTYSLPIHNSFTNANYGKYSSGVAKCIKGFGLPLVNSVLDLYNWTDANFIPSTYELEPVVSDKVYYVGPLIDYSKIKPKGMTRNNIVVYLGNSGFTSREIIKIISDTFINTKWNVFITSKEMNNLSCKNITIAPYFDFNELLANAFLFISHGGQNSLMQSLIYGVPMVSFPGGVQERRFNSAILEKLHTGKMLENIDFNSDKILSVINELEFDKSYSEKAAIIGNSLIKLDGANKIIKVLENLS